MAKKQSRPKTRPPKRGVSSRLKWSRRAHSQSQTVLSRDRVQDRISEGPEEKEKGYGKLSGKRKEEGGDEGEKRE